MIDRAVEQQQGIEPGQTIPPKIVTGKGLEKWGWKRISAFMAIGLPLTAFSTFSRGYGAGEITKLSLEALQTVNAVPALTEFQVQKLSSMVSPVGVVTGFIGGFVLTKMLTEIPEWFRS